MVVKQATPPPQVIVIEPAQPSVVYVPAYNPAVVYGPWTYPAYPPYYYPPPPGYWFSRTVATGIAWGVGIGVTNALWGGAHWGYGHGSVDINVNRYNNINVNRQMNVNSNRSSWNHNTEHRTTAYRGGDATRQNLDKKYQLRQSRAVPRQGREPRREPRACVADDGGSRRRRHRSAREQAQGVDRSAAQQKAQGVDRGAAQQKAQGVDRSAAHKRRRAPIAMRHGNMRKPRARTTL